MKTLMLSFLLGSGIFASSHAFASKIWGTWTSVCEKYSNVSYHYRYIFNSDGTSSTATIRYKSNNCSGWPHVEENKGPYSVLSEETYRIVVRLLPENKEYGGIVETELEFALTSPEIARVKTLAQKKQYDDYIEDVPDSEIARIPANNYFKQP